MTEETKNEIIENSKEDKEMKDSTVKNVVSKAGGFITKHRKKFIAGAIVAVVGSVIAVCRRNGDDNEDFEFDDDLFEDDFDDLLEDNSEEETKTEK